MLKPNLTFLDLFKKTPGAIGVAESIAIMNIAKDAPNGLYADIGSHAGKAAGAAAYGLSATRDSGILDMVDPVFDLKNTEAWQHSVQGSSQNHGWPYVNEEDFLDKTEVFIEEVSGDKIVANLIGDYSENYFGKKGGFAYVFIDSDTHQGGLVMREVKMIEDKVVPGGIIAAHDVGNQFCEPKEALDYLVGTGKYEWVAVNWVEIFDYVRANNLEDNNTSWHEKGSEEFPKFVGAVRRK